MENKKVNINVGYNKLTKEEINSHKNFGKVYQNYVSSGVKPMKVAKRYPFSKLALITTVTVTVTTISIWKYKTTVHHSVKATTAQSSSSANSTSVASKSYDSIKRAFIHPPIKGIDVPYSKYSIDVSKGGVITYNNSKITIPAGAFCDEKGNEIKGKVDINYREFHDAIDFFVSGIPMTYDSAGKQYSFESAGMLDIKGTQNGKPVFIKAGKNLQVAMASRQKGSKYNVYLLDTVKKCWTYIDKSNYTVKQIKTTVTKTQYYASDTISKGQQIAKHDSLPVERKLVSIKKEEKKLEAEKPLHPVKANDNNYTFNIDADSKDFPELSGYKNVVFEVDPSNKDYTPDWTKTEWTDAVLTRKGSNKEDYMFTVSNGNVKHEIFVHPVFQGKNFEQAMSEYNQKFTEYQVKLAAKKEEERKQKEAYDKMLAEMAKKQQEENAKQMAAIKKQQQDDAEAQAKLNRGKLADGSVKERDVICYMNLNSFGIVNCDNPMSLPVGADLTALYTDNNNENLNGTNVFLVEKDRNSVVEYYPGHNCSFNPMERNFAWVVTPNHKIAVYSEEDFSKIQQRNGQFTFVMTVLPNAINSYGDIREALNPYMM